MNKQDGSKNRIWRRNTYKVNLSKTSQGAVKSGQNNTGAFRRTGMLLIIFCLLLGLLQAASYAETTLTVKKADPVRISTAAGAVPELPDTVFVTYSNGTAGNEAVIWDDLSDYKYFNLKSFIIQGQLEKSAFRVKAEVSVTAPEIVALEEITIILPVNTFPKLPDTVTALYSNGTKTTVAAKWDTIDGNGINAGDQLAVSGTVPGTGINAVANLIFIKKSDYSVSGIKNPDALTSIGEKPKLPDIADVTYRDGKPGTLKVTWEETSDDDFSQPGIKEINGVTAAGEFPVKANVQVLPKVIRSVKPIAVSVKVQQNLVLPNVAEVIYISGENGSEPVKWDKFDGAKLKKTGKFTVSGTIEESELRASAVITVK
jgi:hypothetical protein